MANMLYNDPNFDVAGVLTFINEFTRELGICSVGINTQKIEGIIAGMRMDFPHCDGEDAASPFKKAANFLCYFIAERPLLQPFPADIVGDGIAKITNHQNALTGLSFVRKALHGATLYHKGSVIQIKEPIRLSKHSLEDIIDALQCVTPSDHFKLVSVLLEQLAYKANPDCQYLAMP